jgi:hypothetical protein
MRPTSARSLLIALSAGLGCGTGGAVGAGAVDGAGVGGAAAGCASRSTRCSGNEVQTCSGCLDPTWAQWLMPNSAGDVAAGAPNPEAYADNGDGTVMDTVTGLMWQQAVPATTYTWADAVAHCTTLTLAGHDDWRLPSRIELVSIGDDSQRTAETDSTAFPRTPSGYFWSSSRVTGVPSDAWSVVFLGGTFSVVADDPNNVRCVR